MKSGTSIYEKIMNSKPPGLVYHYTSLEAFTAIADDTRTKPSIWATHVNYLNDSVEYRHGLDFACDFIRKRLEADQSDEFLKEVLNVCHQLETKHPFKHYVACFSELQDDAAMWDRYSPHAAGVALGVNFDRLPSEHLVAALLCIYDDHEKDGVLSERLDYYRSQPIEEIMKGLHGFAHNLADLPERQNRAVAFVLDLQIYAIAFKHKSFRAEEEWRLAFFWNIKSASEISFRVGKQTLIPYVSLSLQGENDHWAVEELIIGPSPLQDLTEASVNRFLRCKGLDNVTSVKKCESTLRSV